MSPLVIKLRGWRYPLARFQPLGWVLAMLATALVARALPFPAGVAMGLVLVVIVPLVIVAGRMTRGQDPPWWTMVAAIAWWVMTALWGPNPITLTALAAGGLVFGWQQLAEPGPWRVEMPHPEPLVFESDLGTAVLLRLPRSRAERMFYDCTGCLAHVAASSPEEDLRPEANRHARECRSEANRHARECRSVTYPGPPPELFCKEGEPDAAS